MICHAQLFKSMKSQVGAEPVRRGFECTAARVEPRRWAVVLVIRRDL